MTTGRATVGGGAPTNYVWDREDGLPLLVGDGTNAYLHEDGALAQINGAGRPEYLLDDALGSRRGVTDLAGTLTGTADYDTFGAVRASSGAGMCSTWRSSSGTLRVTMSQTISSSMVG